MCVAVLRLYTPHDTPLLHKPTIHMPVGPKVASSRGSQGGKRSSTQFWQAAATPRRLQHVHLAAADHAELPAQEHDASNGLCMCLLASQSHAEGLHSLTESVDADMRK